MAFDRNIKPIVYFVVIFALIQRVFPAGTIPTDVDRPDTEETPCKDGTNCDKIYVPITYPNYSYELTPTQYALLISVCVVLLCIAAGMRYLCHRRVQQNRKNQQIASQLRVASSNDRAQNGRRADAERANQISNSSNWRTHDSHRIQVDSMVDRVNNQQGGLPSYESFARTTVIDLPPAYEDALRSNPPKL